ncbi:MAG: flagellar hook-associated protein FlgK [Lachnospiraceae bacterium]|nr:flagellar hook-associated protein FlgK [Lachnospiraceae bacterium]MDD7628342.1 flagellar hook-associated protein FlgK [Lachnospiraceae bacterium]MDY4119392.1 flagellar hook-associated protein FlgK [Lachnospiraceae bacterium]
MSLMGSLYVGTSGLQTGQNALNTTAHNMSNIDTTGYTRQQVQQGTRYYNTISKTASANSYQQIGLGVNYSQVKQVRDYFLDKTYRRESGRSAFYEASVAAVEEVEDLFQELQGQTFSGSIKNLWESVQELAKDPSNSVNQGVFIQRCNEFITRGQAVYQGLCEYQDNLNFKIGQQVDKINEYGKEIRDLNVQILKIEAGDVEHANDLRDQRNQLLDELSSMANISYYEDVDGNVIVQLEGNDFVKEDTINEIGLYEDELTGFYTPYWVKFADNSTNPPDITGAHVYDMTQTISMDTNTDIGSLKSMLYARGDHRATYKDLEDKTVYNRDISQSVIMNVQAEFDRLINGVVTGINKVLKEAAENAGSYPNSTYLRDSNGDPYQVFNMVAEEKDASGNVIDNFSIENIVINGELKQAPSLLGFIRPSDDKADQDIANKLKEVFTTESYTLNPNVETKTNLVNYYDNLVSQVANTGSVMRGISENQQLTVDNTAAAREQIVGVSSDEELSNMIMFQNAYNAASRYINVISEMLEHVIATLGT